MIIVLILIFLGITLIVSFSLLVVYGDITARSCRRLKGWSSSPRQL